MDRSSFDWSTGAGCAYLVMALGTTGVCTVVRAGIDTDVTACGASGCASLTHFFGPVEEIGDFGEDGKGEG